MVLDDVNFSAGEGQDFILEIPVGTLNAPIDMLVETDSDRHPVLEAPLIEGGGDIFILND